MKKKNYRGIQCVKQHLSKCNGVCRTYDKIQTAYVILLEQDNEIVSFECNVPLEGVAEDQYASDIVAGKADGTTMVRECVSRRHLGRPTTAKLLDISRNYWTGKGVTDWGIAVDKEDDNAGK